MCGKAMTQAYAVPFARAVHLWTDIFAGSSRERATWECNPPEHAVDALRLRP